jgi:hypothetical protein
MAIPDAGWGLADDTGFRYAVASISRVHPGLPNWTSSVLVTLRERSGAVEVVGIERPSGLEERK